MPRTDDNQLYALLDRKLKDLAEEHVRVINQRLFCAPFYAYPLFTMFYKDTRWGKARREVWRRVRHAFYALVNDARYCEDYGYDD